jgi:glycerophosphoryl diester phosphodiesterase
LTSFRRGLDGGVLRIGHRGAAALEPENTLRSFERAITLGVDFVEFDVLDLRDGTLVLAHSNDLREVSHGAASGRVRPLALDELRRAAPELPTLEQALEFFRLHDVGLHVDVKCRQHSRLLVEALRRHGLIERSIVSSFWPRTLREVKAAEPGLAVALTYPEDRHGLARRRPLEPLVLPTVKLLGRLLPRRLPRWLEALGAPVAMLHYAVVSRSVIERCHASGAAVWAWTVNDQALLEWVVGLGVDGVITDDPGIFRATLIA